MRTKKASISDFPKCDNDKINHELIEKVDSIKK